MKILNAYSKFLNVLTKILKVILIALLAAMTLIMLFQVIMRYVFSNAQPWCEELTIYMSMLSIMLALGIASRSDSHLQVDFLTRLYGPKLRCFMAALWSIVTIIAMVVFAKYGVELIGHAKSRSMTMPITMGQVYTVFPLGSVILILYSIEIAARNLIGFFHGGELPALPSAKEGGSEK